MTGPSNAARAAQLLQSGLTAQQGGDFAAAQKHYLEAARLMLAQAQAASPAARQQIYEQAMRIKARADALAPQVTTQADGRRKQQEDARRAVPALKDEEPVPDWLLAERPTVRLKDVAGLEDVKEQIHLKLIYPFTHPEAARRYGVKAGGGILLYGPPGTGKTYIARAVAGELDAAFFVAKASNLMSQWFGKAEQNIAALFDAARKWPRAVVFLDEIEALIPARSATHSSVMPRVISEFLAQMQSLGNKEDTAMLLLGATNEPWAIDAAALRPGRFDELIYVGLPDYAARLRLLELNLRDRPLSSDVDLLELAEQMEGYSGADITYLSMRTGQMAFLDEVHSGAMRAITPEDFTAAMAERKPSVTPQMVRKFEKFRDEHSSTG